MNATNGSKSNIAQSSGELAVTRIINNRGALTKKFSLDADGVLQVDASAKVYDGRAETVRCHDLMAFMQMRASLASNQALTYGITGKDSVGITTQTELRERPTAHRGKIARDSQSFHFGKGPGILMLDHDAGHLPSRYSRDSLRDALLNTVPELDLAPMAWAASASSCIFDNRTGEELKGLGGQRIYIPVVDATDIPRLGRLIYERLWAAGLGAYVVSTAGVLLDRNLVDASAWQAERLDFAAGAHCAAPLEQRAPHWHVWEAGYVGGIDPFDSRRFIPDLTSDQTESASKHRAVARAAKAAESRTARDGWIETRAQEHAETSGVDIEQARTLVRDAAERQLLFADFVLHPERGGPVKVGEVLDNIDKWHGTRFCDPMEPAYRGDRRIAWVNLRSGGRPYIFSWAHGLNRRYELLRQPVELRIESGETSRLADECLRVMRERGDIFDFGSDGMVRVAEGIVKQVTRAYLQDRLGRDIRFSRFDGRSKTYRPRDCPETLALFIVERNGERGLPKLKGVVTAPTMRVDGSVVDLPGYDEDTGLLFLSDEPTPPRITLNPSRTEVLDALRELIEPIAKFPFADRESRGVALAAMFTSCVRRGLPKAPGFGLDAPTAGTGKTLLAETILVLGGHSPASMPAPTNIEETNKIFLAALLAGAGAIFFDNFATPVGGAAIDQFLTAEHYGGRVLGTSVNQASLPNGALLLVTGNNLEIKGDTTRRMLICRLDSQKEHPSRRSFGFDPVHYVRSRRPRLVRAAITLMRGYLTSGAVPKDRPLGSFEPWDALVRQTVCWLSDFQSEFDLGDPNVTTERSDAVDDSKSQLQDLLKAWRGAFGDQPRSAAEVIDFAQVTVAEDFGQKDWRTVALREALQPLLRHSKDKLTSVRLGHWLRANKGKVANGYRFEGFKDRDQITQWTVKATGAGDAGDAGDVSNPSINTVRLPLLQVGQESTPATPASPAGIEFADFADLA